MSESQTSNLALGRTIKILQTTSSLLFLINSANYQVERQSMMRWWLTNLLLAYDLVHLSISSSIISNFQNRCFFFILSLFAEYTKHRIRLIFSSQKFDPSWYTKVINNDQSIFRSMDRGNINLPQKINMQKLRWPKGRNTVFNFKKSFNQFSF